MRECDAVSVKERDVPMVQAKTAVKKKAGPIERLHPRAERVRTWFFSASPTALAAWFLIVAVCVAVLVWFFLFSSYGAPAEPVYEGF